eukprot:8664839-Prorocentrum_lima.AAC.1
MCTLLFRPGFIANQPRPAPSSVAGPKAAYAANAALQVLVMRWRYYLFLYNSASFISCLLYTSDAADDM